MYRHLKNINDIGRKITFSVSYLYVGCVNRTAQVSSSFKKILKKTMKVVNISNMVLCVQLGESSDSLYFTSCA